MTALAFPKSPRIEDPAHLVLVRTLACCAPLIGNPRADRHWGDVEAHHETGAGLALKADDHRSMPLCKRHHGDFHRLCGVFANWTKRTLKAWQREMVAATQDALRSLRATDFVDGREAIATTGEAIIDDESRLLLGGTF